MRLRTRVDPLARTVDVIVRDDGSGMDAAKLAAVERGDRPDDASGVGLTNVRERLALLFGDRHGFTLRSQPGEGTTCTCAC